MQRIDGTRKQQVSLIGLSVLLVAAIFPLAAPEKTVTLVAYVGFSALLLLFTTSRLQVLLVPVALSFVMLVASFFTPVEIALTRNKPFRVSWMRCTVVGSRTADRPVATEYVIYRGCCQINGVEPVRVLKICIP